MGIDVERAAKIAEANDKFRCAGFGFMMTHGVRSLEAQHRLIEEIRKYSDFTEDNDPYGEHDFGSLVWYGKKVFWKIDYYDNSLEYDLDPLDEECRRVLTIMLASEH